MYIPGLCTNSHTQVWNVSLFAVPKHVYRVKFENVCLSCMTTFLLSMACAIESTNVCARRSTEKHVDNSYSPNYKTASSVKIACCKSEQFPLTQMRCKQSNQLPHIIESESLDINCLLVCVLFCNCLAKINGLVKSNGFI